MNKFVSHMFANILNILHIFTLIGLFILYETLLQTAGNTNAVLIVLCTVFVYVFFVGYVATIISIKETLHSIEETLKEFKSKP